MKLGCHGEGLEVLGPLEVMPELPPSSAPGPPLEPPSELPSLRCTWALAPCKAEDLIL